ncbi:MAG: hypothetical protein WA902_13520 [Thermosynechococcaceae cyanobacterium]
MKSTTLLISIGLAFEALVSDAMTGGLLFSQTKAIAQPQPYPQSVIDVLIDTCIQNDTFTRSYCECTIDGLQQAMSYEELMAYVDKNGPRSKPPAAFSNAASACLSAKKTTVTKPEPSSKPSYSASTSYPPFVVQSYMQGCEVESKAPRQFCQCSIDEIQKRLSFNDFMQWSYRLQQDSSTQFPSAVTESALFCATEHGTSNRLNTPDQQALSLYAGRF